ncbi:alpha/beta hydrolase [Undibacterium sp. LX40W]|uniref:Alpha/beta hydrolase n=1 Tax=Undibacterium nitidum TaxID=2762298 RepID=A0A923KUX4_9BURK|nr:MULTISPECIES: alpha/beta hydrolase-fold protein [Undibacterium]MBC3883169.1 alpha/beta hydrolase [Undibacterium nitidum]MBC3893451.1 alpha/beta hydrolase [Undibacterium sp. LX40W]
MKTIAIFLLSLCAMTSACEAKRDNSTLQSTAQANVSILADKLAMPGLNRSRQIRIYLPPDYAKSDKTYPVLYMHDAQNLFDVRTSYAGEWGVDETMNALAASGKLELIVVGIDNGESKRMNELNPWDNPEFSPAEGKQYVEFIVKVLKPYIDQHYRSKPDRANTGIMGSSMGGLISHYAINQFPEVFSKAGIYSPSYWISKQSLDFIARQPAARDARLYIASGEKEGGSQVADAKKSYEELIKVGHPGENLSLKIVAGAEHNEKFWREDFEQAVLWLFKEPAKN